MVVEVEIINDLARTLKMKYKIGDDLQVVMSDKSVHPHIWEVVGLCDKNPFIVQVKDKGTDYTPHWVDISLMKKATPAKR